MGCRTPTTVEFRIRLGFKQHDIIITKEQSQLRKIMKVFAKEEILLQYSVLSYRINLYFPKHRLVIEVDEKGHEGSDGNKMMKNKKSRKRT